MKETEFKITVLPEADKSTMLKEQYKLETMGFSEWEIMEECNKIDKKLKEIKEYQDCRCRCENGYKNRRR